MLLLLGESSQSPLSIVGGASSGALVGWYRGGSLDSQASASAVVTWNDESGQGNHVTQATGSKQPSLVKNQLAGHSIVRFDGTADILAKASPVGMATSSGDLFVVFKKAASATYNIVASADEAGAVNYIILLRVVTRTTQRLEVVQDANDTDDTITGGTTIGTTAFSLAEVASSGTAYTIRHNGTAETLTETTGTNTGDWLADTPNRDNFTIGGWKRSTEDSWFGGDIAEVALYNRPLTDGERAQFHQYIRSKYGLTIA